MISERDFFGVSEVVPKAPLPNTSSNNQGSVGDAHVQSRGDCGSRELGRSLRCAVGIRDATCADHLLNSHKLRHMQEERTVDYLVIAIEAICREIAFDVLILEFLRQGHWSMGIYMLWMVTCNFRPGEPLSIQRGDIQIPFQGISSLHQVLLYPEDRPLRSKTYAANDTVELYCPWCATSLSHGNPRNVSSALVITTSWWCGAE